MISCYRFRPLSLASSDPPRAWLVCAATAGIALFADRYRLLFRHCRHQARYDGLEQFSLQRPVPTRRRNLSKILISFSRVMMELG